jgi:Peptidase_C39 like family
MNIVSKLPFMLLSLGATGSVSAATLPFDHQFQEHSNWCWLAATTNLLAYHGKTTTQCELANWAFDRNDACGNTDFAWDHPANTAGYLYGAPNAMDKMFQREGLSTTPYNSAFGAETLKSSIDGQRPVVAFWEWVGGGVAHMITVFGYVDDPGGLLLNYSDPYPGEGKKLALYDWVRAGGDGALAHRWTLSLEVR